MRVAVDAANLVRDGRGLGRVTRGVLAAALADGSFALTLLADRRDDVRTLARSYPGTAVAATASARKCDAYDLVWYPFNGMRFRSAAPSIVTIADAFAFTDPHPSRIARARERAPIRRAAREATQLVTISQWSRGELARELGIAPARIAVVPLAPDAYWYPAPGDALPQALARARFSLVVGVREPRKNARLALAAFARAQRDERDWLVVVGDLSAADTAYARALGVRSGTISPDDALLRALYRHAVVVLVPSLAEGFGLVAVEALACGAPVIAADSSALPEATAGAALLRNPHDVAAWADTIRGLYDDPARAAALGALAAAQFAAADRTAPARATLELFHATARVR